MAGVVRHVCGCTFEADDVAAEVGDVEAERDAWVLGDVAQLRLAGLAVDQDRVVVLDEEPDGTECGRPDGPIVVSQAMRLVCSRPST